MTVHGLGGTRACGLIGIFRSLYCFDTKRPDDAWVTFSFWKIAALPSSFSLK
jgi:putative transposase